MEIMEKCIPKVTISTKHNFPWMSSTIKAKMRKRNSAYRRARKTGCPSLWNKYNSLRYQVVNILRQSKREHLRKVSGQGCKQFWKTVKLLKNASSQTPTLKTDSGVAFSNTAKASLLNEVLSQNFNRTIPPLANTDYHFFMADPSSTFPEEIFCTEEEVLDLLLTVDTSKATGSDGISGRMLKSTAHSIAPGLTELFNLSIRTGRIPQQWKTSSVVPIPKSSTNTDDPRNYRPISRGGGRC